MLAHSSGYIEESESRKQKAKAAKGGGNGFQVLGLSEPVYKGIVRMGFRVSEIRSKWKSATHSGYDFVLTQINLYFYVIDANSCATKGTASYFKWR